MSDAGAAAEDPLIGMVLDERYRIMEPLGEGGIGKVYKARHLILGRMIALKVLLAEYESLPVLRQRFQREAEALAALSHPNIVTVTDFGVADDMPYLVMELLEGRDLAHVLYNEMIEPKRGLAMIRQVLRALAYAHERGLVHRDLKPHNVIVRPMGDGTDHVAVLDFGLARFMDEERNKRPKLTKTGALIGTPAYMAPEQATGDVVDERADVYATGLLLFEVLSGRRPFTGTDPGEQLRAHLLMEPPPITRVDTGLEISDGLQAFLRRALSKPPAERFANGAEMLSALDALGPEPARRIGPRTQEPMADSLAVARTHVASPIGGARAALRPVTTESLPSLPRPRWPLFVGAGCIALLLLSSAAIGVLWWLESRASHEVPRPVPTVPVPPVPNGIGTVQPVAPVAPRLPARDPFATPLPDALAALYSKVQAHQRLSPAEIHDLLDVRRTEGNDVRPSLVLAHYYADQRALSQAFPFYSEAFAHDSSSRGDPEMQRDLVEMAALNSSGPRADAADAIAAWYGAEAVQFLNHQIATPQWPGGRRVTGDERDRLSELRDRVSGSGGSFDPHSP